MPEDFERVQRLQQRIQDLVAENEKLQVENVITVVKKVEVLPKNYEADMKRLKNLEKEIKRTKKIMEFGNINSLETLITEFESFSKIKLEKIAQEYQFFYTNHEERVLLKELIEYLTSIITQLEQFLFIQEPDKVGDDK